MCVVETCVKSEKKSSVIETSISANKIHVSEHTKFLLEQLGGFTLEERGTSNIKVRPSSACMTRSMAHKHKTCGDELLLQEAQCPWRGSRFCQQLLGCANELQVSRFLAGKRGNEDVLASRT